MPLLLVGLSPVKVLFVTVSVLLFQASMAPPVGALLLVKELFVTVTEYGVDELCTTSMAPPPYAALL